VGEGTERELGGRVDGQTPADLYLHGLRDGQFHASEHSRQVLIKMLSTSKLWSRMVVSD
jgi:hypothetical protein